MEGEALNRLVFPYREYITLPYDLRGREGKAIADWRSLGEEDFVKGALPLMHSARNVAKSWYTMYGHQLDDVMVSLDGPQGEEARKMYCISFYNSLQSIPESEWRGIS